jgi:uncharacterized membrane protein
LLLWIVLASPLPAPAPTHAPAPGRAGTRVLAIDWLRGLAVVLMIQAHAFDAWLSPAAKAGSGYWLIRHMSGLPSRMFLFLVGISAALRFEALLARGAPRRQMMIEQGRRGLQILGLAYLFRLQEHVLAGFKGGWSMLVRVDILNAIGASLLLLAAVAAPRKGRPSIAVPLLLAAILIALGPIVGPAHFPWWLPRPLTSYIGGQRPMAWFPLFPWGAWALLGVVVGHLWIRQGRTAAGAARVFILSAVAGLGLMGLVSLVRAVAPDLIHYPSDVVQQMGPGSFFFRLGLIGVLAGLSWLATWRGVRGFSPMVQLGRTSLLVYWIHVDLCYGGIARYLRGRLSIPAATVWLLLLVGLMLVVSVLKTRYARPVGAWLASRWASLRARRLDRTERAA